MVYKGVLPAIADLDDGVVGSESNPLPPDAASML